MINCIQRAYVPPEQHNFHIFKARFWLRAMSDDTIIHILHVNKLRETFQSIYTFQNFHTCIINRMILSSLLLCFIVINKRIRSNRFATKQPNNIEIPRSI